MLREGLVKANQPAAWPQTVLPCPGLTLDNGPDTLGQEDYGGMPLGPTSRSETASGERGNGVAQIQVEIDLSYCVTNVHQGLCWSLSPCLPYFCL